MPIDSAQHEQVAGLQRGLVLAHGAGAGGGVIGRQIMQRTLLDIALCSFSVEGEWIRVEGVAEMPCGLGHRFDLAEAQVFGQLDALLDWILETSDEISAGES
jgi:hypothetical protein